MEVNKMSYEEIVRIIKNSPGKAYIKYHESDAMYFSIAEDIPLGVVYPFPIINGVKFQPSEVGFITVFYDGGISLNSFSNGVFAKEIATIEEVYSITV